MTPQENRLVAYAILDEVNAMLDNGARPEDIARDIARAQVYATLATVAPPAPDRDAFVAAVDGRLRAEGVELTLLQVQAVAEAVGRLL